MKFDVPTLMVAGAFVALMSGALLLFAWYQYRETAAALWWAGADFILGCAIVSLAVGSGTDTPLVFFCGLTLPVCSIRGIDLGRCARSFDGETVSPLLLDARCVDLDRRELASRQCVMTFTVSTLLNAGIYPDPIIQAAAVSIRTGKGEALRARPPLVVLLSVHALTLLIAVPATLTVTFVPNTPPPVLSWFGVIHFSRP